MATDNHSFSINDRDSAERVAWMQKRLPYIAFGGDYNPEQWMPEQGYEGESIWLEDMRLMKLAGVNMATVGVFSWAALQPAENTFTFEWLDRVMDLLAQNGISACLATPSAAQPAWLSQAYPDVLPVNGEGVRRQHGNRQNYCPTSPDFRRLSSGLARRLAERYGEHPALALWHVSNEYGPYCYCERCAARFRDWLKKRYSTLTEVNRCWATAFWSHTYTAWDQIYPPGKRGEQSIQGLILDYNRFMSDMLLECYRGEADVLHEITPEVPVTTNLMEWHKPLDYFSWAPYLDVISWDSYPQMKDHPASVALRHDLMRGLKAGQPWLLMEQTPSQVQWREHNPLKRPDIMRLLSYQALARGSDAVMFFQWRASRGSMEKYHGAIVSHAGHEHTRVFNDVANLGKELHELGSSLLGARLPARVALVFSWPNWWNVEYRPGLSNSLNYVEEIERYYRPLWEKNITVDIVPPDRDLSGYELVIAPLLNMVSAEEGASIERYVENGGTFLTTFFSGVVDEHDLAWLGGYPGPLRKTLGIWVEEFDPLEADMQNKLFVAGVGVEAEETRLTPGSYSCDLWCENIHLEGARAIATFEKDFYAGQPAITENRFGKGRALYVATRPDAALLKELLETLLADHAIEAPLQVPAGVEVTLRESNEQRFIFILNHNVFPVEVSLPSAMLELLSGQTFFGSINLTPRGVAILKR